MTLSQLFSTPINEKFCRSWGYFGRRSKNIYNLFQLMLNIIPWWWVIVCCLHQNLQLHLMIYSIMKKSGARFVILPSHQPLVIIKITSNHNNVLRKIFWMNYWKNSGISVIMKAFCYANGWDKIVGGPSTGYKHKISLVIWFWRCRFKLCNIIKVYWYCYTCTCVFNL